MLGWLSQYMPEWFANFLISLLAATTGVGMRIGQLVAHNKVVFSWSLFVWEIPTVFGMAITAGPVGIWLNKEYGVDLSATYALCVFFSVLGVRVFDRVALWLEKLNAKDK